MIATTRLAPSPTGALHLGNARTFLVNWLLARQNDWRVLLRIDDIDGARVKRDADALTIEDLLWLGLDFDQGPTYQSHHLASHRDAVQRLLDRGLAYACVCTRREIEQAASAPHADDGAAVYGGACRGRFASIADALSTSGRPPVVRFAVPPGVVRFDDNVAGPVAINVATQLGDFVIAKNDGTPAYQLATVVDDHSSSVTHVVRGDDLLESACRQLLLLRALHPDAPTPHYYHLPLLLGPDGRRLAKRHGDTRLASYRATGCAPARVLALLARSIGVSDVSWQIDLPQLLSRFDLTRLPRQALVFSAEADHWLHDTAPTAPPPLAAWNGAA